MFLSPIRACTYVRLVNVGTSSTCTSKTAFGIDGLLGFTTVYRGVPTIYRNFRKIPNVLKFLRRFPANLRIFPKIAEDFQRP